MSIELIYKILEKQPELVDLLRGLNKTALFNKKVGLIQAAKPVLISWLNHGLNCPVLFISASQESAHQLYYDIQNWFPESSALYLLQETIDPSKENPRFNSDELSTRLRILEMFTQYDAKSGNLYNQPVVNRSGI